MVYHVHVCVTWLPRVLNNMSSYYKFLNRLLWRKLSSQEFIRRLEDSKFGADFNWDARLFQIIFILDFYYQM